MPCTTIPVSLFEQTVFLALAKDINSDRYRHFFGEKEHPIQRFICPILNNDRLLYVLAGPGISFLPA